VVEQIIPKSGRQSDGFFDPDRILSFFIAFVGLGLVMGPGQKFLTWVGSSQFFLALVGLGRVSHLWFGSEFGKFPLKMSNFSFFFLLGQKNLSESTWVEGGSASYLLQVKSKLGSGRVRTHL